MSERLEGRKELEYIRSSLKPRTIIFFDDPFGIYEYEGRESLEREIKTIIANIKNVDRMLM